MKSGKKQELNFDLNLVPMIDILSVCVSFLLMTVIWLQLGAMTVGQAVGGQSQSEAKNPPTVWAYLNPGGQVILTLKNVTDMRGKMRNVVVPPGVNGEVRWPLVESTMLAYQKNNIDTGIIMPSKATTYADIIHLMDNFKKYGIKNVGVSPL